MGSLPRGTFGGQLGRASAFFAASIISNCQVKKITEIQ